MHVDACRTPNLAETQQEMFLEFLMRLPIRSFLFGEQIVVTYHVQEMRVHAAFPFLAGLIGGSGPFLQGHRWDRSPGLGT